jgi:hypothetical protein
MKTQRDITYVIANLVRQSVTDLESRLEAQKRALSEKNCTTPLLSIWMDARGADYLLSVFALNDEEISAELPEAAGLSGHQRHQIVAVIEEHLEHCPRCSLRYSHDKKLDEEIEGECRKNTDFLLDLLDDNENISDLSH